jgi:hypothetical protein
MREKCDYIIKKKYITQCKSHLLFYLSFLSEIL